jgi:hypothetical protein
MIITRYKLHKITGINESVFSQMWKRHLAGKDFYSFFTDDGKVDIDDSGFIKKYSHKVIPEELEKLKNKKVPVKKVPVKTPKPKSKEKKEIVIDPPPEKPKDEELSDLQRKSTIAKCKSEIYKSEKAEMELKKARAELAELQTIGQVCIGYLMAVNQNLLDQPRSWIDEISSGIKAGKSKTDLTDLARKPAMEAISEAIELINKEIAKYKRDVKSSIDE